MTYGTKIQTVTVGAGGATSIDFTSIPSTFTDLYIIAATRTNGGATIRSMNMRLNDSTSSYTERMIDSNGSNVTAASTSGSLINWLLQNDTNSTANTFSNVGILIPNYAASINKSAFIMSSTENNATEANNRATVAQWANTAAVTKVSLLAESGTSFLQNSTATLYGISNSSDTMPTVKATGGTIFKTAQYVYHVFTGSGTFTPNGSLTADLLLIGGGGGGGGMYYGSAAYGGGGGGAGTITYNSGMTINYPATIVIGSGGASDFNESGGSGTATLFKNANTNQTISYGSPGYGGDWGGQGGSNDSYSGAYSSNVGGGGAGSAQNGQGNNGGWGSSNYSQILSIVGAGVKEGDGLYHLGGGGGGGVGSYGGGAGGYGGGGSAASNGVSNTGSGGGGGSSWAWNGAGSGGSGLAIVRYQ
jgi:hypothetical protein